MATAELPLIPSTLPSGYCFETWQQTLNDFATHLTVQFESSSFTTIIRSASAPAITQIDKSWHNTNDGRLYFWSTGQGKWVVPHELAAGGGDRRFVELSTAEIETYDGGVAGTVGPSSGPMWEVDSEYTGRVAIGAGSMPGRTISPTSNAVGDMGGRSEVTQTGAQVGSHQHDFTGPALSGSLSNSGDNSISIPSLPSVTATTELNQSTASPMDNMPPYRAGYWIKRTARIYRVGT